uniref:Cytoplasmic dynein 2 light intermediate chain 1 n=1 Tax=Eptatretus burgeri TaxID=7764 RepID=A0A8C4Q6N6_EPTBU
MQQDAENNDRLRPQENTIFFFGTKNGGKTTVIHQFLDRDEPPRPTVALNYSFARKTRGQVKDIAHVWELGGGTLFSSLLKIPITAKTIRRLTLVLVLDLSAPERFCQNFLDLLMLARASVQTAVAELDKTDHNIHNQMKNKMLNKFGRDHVDRNKLDLFSTPLLILGTKYDLFQMFDSDKQKLICKTLRFVSHVHGGTLLFTSNTKDSMMTRTRNVINHLVFSSPLG